MMYSPSAVHLLHPLGIPLEWVTARHLQEHAEASQLETVERGADGRVHLLTPTATVAWRRLKDAAEQEGVVLHIVSAFRSVERQTAIIERKLAAGLSIAEILAVSAPPHFSEHHAGTAVDIGTPGCRDLEQTFETTPAFAWLSNSAGRFGFVMSYPAGNASGYAYEPWHWRYAG